MLIRIDGFLCEHYYEIANITIKIYEEKFDCQDTEKSDILQHMNEYNHISPNWNGLNQMRIF